MIKFGILTVSTTCSENPAKDRAGPMLENEIRNSLPDCQIIFKQIVTDNKSDIIQILNAVTNSSVCDVLITVGGTGFSPSDVTPEATKCVIEKDAPGLVHTLISKSLAVTDMAMLSRPVCGIKNKTIIVNFPGSSKAAVECFGFIKTSLLHAVAVLREDNLKVKIDHEHIQNECSLSQESKVNIRVGISRMRKSPYPMLEVEEAKKLIFNIIAFVSETMFEVIPIEEAATRVLAEDIKASNPVPAFPASIKDGYAVNAIDGAGHRSVRSVAAAGDTPDYRELQPGEAIRISTGAPVPAGADAIVQVEDTELVKVSENGKDEQIVNILIAPKVGQDIRAIGSDIKANTIVLKSNSEVSPAYIGVLALLGITNIKVTRRLSIGIISTGNELVQSKKDLRPGLIYDSNKITLLSLLKSYGYEAKDCGIARDTPDSVKTILGIALENNDFIISSGGVSMGEYDLIKQVLTEDFNATIHFGRLNMKPGKPTVFATLELKGKKKIVFALPGNPVSCCVTSLLFVIPALKYIEKNEKFKGWPTINATLSHEIVNMDSRPEYVRVIVSPDTNNQLVVSSTGRQISSRLNSMVDANALLHIPGKTTLTKGALAPVYLFGTLF